MRSINRVLWLVLLLSSVAYAQEQRVSCEDQMAAAAVLIPQLERHRSDLEHNRAFEIAKRDKRIRQLEMELANLKASSPAKSEPK